MRSYIYITIFFLSTLSGVVSAQENISFFSSQTSFIAGDKVALKFKTNDATPKYKMYCTNSYGSTVIKSKTINGGVLFELPEHFTKKRGLIYWKVFQNKKVKIKGAIYINPKEKPKSLEMYLGPPSIEAGGNDFTMLVTIPTDSLDNPLPENTSVNLKTQFLATKNKTKIQTKNLIAYRNIYSPLKSGRMLLSTNHQQKNSTEFDVTIVPAIPKNFQISFDRNHNYADGNQITTFYTSVLKDKNNNIVSDGTFVYFFITDTENAVLQTYGQTLNGVAKAKMIHPDKASNWKVKAFIEGISESNSLAISYEKAVKDFNISLFKNNTQVKVGPFTSFMNQMIPDGLQVTLTVLQQDKIIKTYHAETRKGFVNFILNKNFFKKGTYTFNIEAAGVIKNIENISLW
ncbi:hypothetical protein [uncultured Polaribacter sp.]|uniref:hypothetical protein n=1 Tax=uncultured Polaribacter sp. TaxID=174711 RepID=UPI00259BA2A1|nr:hypothetical protein [uncultured Polaribacter sp.]